MKPQDTELRALHVHTPEEREKWDREDEHTGMDLGKVPVTITLPAADMQDMVNAYADRHDGDRARLVIRNVQAHMDQTMRRWLELGVPPARPKGAA